MWCFETLRQAAREWPFRTVALARVDSTSRWVRRHAPQHPCLVIAWEQTGGYGQRGRSWRMRPGKDLTFTLWLPQSGQLARHGMLTPYVALKLQQTLSPWSEQPLRCKWPNDLYGPHGKVSGTLVERQGDGLMVGTGINWWREGACPNAITAHATPWEWLALWGAWALETLPSFQPDHWRRVMGDWVDVDWFQRGALVEDERGDRYRYGGIQPDGSVLLLRGRQAVRAHSGSRSLRPVNQSPYR